jgi:hypothetical protein
MRVEKKKAIEEKETYEDGPVVGVWLGGGETPR